jgi:hypothetical protein
VILRGIAVETSQSDFYIAGKEDRMRLKTTLAAAAAMFTGVTAANAVILYDGSLGTAPDAQPWLVYDGLGSAAHTTSGPVTALDTTSSLGNEAGYSNYQPTSLTTASLKNTAFPTLDPSLGFDLTFTAELQSESHSSNDRGGFDVILLDKNHVGVELDFWTTQVWAQNVGFTHGEGTTGFDPTSTLHNYDLHIADGNYTLSADGSAILTGVTRDYSAGGLPYTLGDYVFFGDDTTSAAAAVEFSQIAVVPEPGGVALLIGGVIAVAGRRRSRRAGVAHLIRATASRF